MRNKITVVLLMSFLTTILNIGTACSNGGESLNETSIDLSSPEKAIQMYYEAFRTGNDNLLKKVLAPGASIPEFNPLQKIVEPSPEIVGVVINKIQAVNERRRYAAPDKYTEPSDLEVRATVKFDPHIVSIAEDRTFFLLRKFDDKWKIIANEPFWPEDIEEIQKLIREDFSEDKSDDDQ